MTWQISLVEFEGASNGAFAERAVVPDLAHAEGAEADVAAGEDARRDRVHLADHTLALLVGAQPLQLLDPLLFLFFSLLTFHQQVCKCLFLNNVLFFFNLTLPLQSCLLILIHFFHGHNSLSHQIPLALMPLYYLLQLLHCALLTVDPSYGLLDFCPEVRNLVLQTLLLDFHVFNCLLESLYSLHSGLLFLLNLTQMSFVQPFYFHLQLYDFLLLEAEDSRLLLQSLCVPLLGVIVLVLQHHQLVLGLGELFLLVVPETFHGS